MDHVANQNLNANEGEIQVFVGGKWLPLPTHNVSSALIFMHERCMTLHNRCLVLEAENHQLRGNNARHE
jgi:hypothetical protein